MTSNGDGRRADDLFDRYLDACAAGAIEDPGAFCARHGVRDGRTLERLRAVHRQALRGRARRADAPPFGRLGEFRIVRRLGQGGMGTVYVAEQESLGRRVALKVVRSDLAASATAGERFQREAQEIARLEHRNIVKVCAAGEDGGVRYLAMELLDGRGLEDVLRDVEPVATATLLKWAADVARALEHAHRRGVVHRDVKPSDIRILPDGPSSSRASVPTRSTCRARASSSATAASRAGR